MAESRGRSRHVNLPIGLTLTRIVAVPLLIVFLISSSRVHALIAVAIFILASITDWADGAVARRRNQVTTLGSAVDYFYRFFRKADYRAIVPGEERWS